VTDTARVTPTRGDFVTARAASAASFSMIFAITAWRSRF
jgi:hypothetical protein